MKTYFTVAKHGANYRIHYRHGDLKGIMQPFFNKQEVAEVYCEKLRLEQPCINEYYDTTLNQYIGRVLDKRA